MSASVNNPQRLLLALDEGLDHEVVLVLYGRAALVLGYDGAPVEMGATKDVDAIIQLRKVEALSNDEQFWDARDSVNARFNDEGLYITHLFGEEQVFLRPEWERHIVPVLRPPTRSLRLFRPHTIDLILTKMMRGNDEQDMEPPCGRRLAIIPRSMPWQPTFISFAGNSLATATETLFVTTNADNGYLKAIGNRGGPHMLARNRRHPLSGGGSSARIVDALFFFRRRTEVRDRPPRRERRVGTGEEARQVTGPERVTDNL